MRPFLVVFKQCGMVVNFSAKMTRFRAEVIYLYPLWFLCMTAVCITPHYAEMNCRET